jgi:hypothetical protein
MSEEKVRVSGEMPRSPILPTLNPKAEQAAAEKAKGVNLPVPFYVGYVMDSRSFKFGLTYL